MEKIYAAKLEAFYWDYPGDRESIAEMIDVSYDPFPGLTRDEALKKLGTRYLPENLGETNVSLVSGHFDENGEFVEDEEA